MLIRCNVSPNRRLESAAPPHPELFDMTRAKLHGFEPLITIEDGIKETIEWYLKNKSDADTKKDVFKYLQKLS